jgi:hypothetical protein
MASTCNFKSWKVLCWNVRGFNSDKKNGMQLETRLMTAFVILFVYKKQNGNLLTCSSFENSVLQALTVSSFYLLWVLPEVW